MKHAIAIIGMLSLGLLSQNVAVACSVDIGPVGVPVPEPSQKMRDTFTRNLFGRDNAVVRVRTIIGGEVGFFLVTQTYRGKIQPMNLITMPVNGASSCGPGRVSWLSEGVLVYNPYYEYSLFSHFTDEVQVKNAIRLGVLPKPKRPPIPLDMALGFVLMLVASLAFLGLRRMLMKFWRRHRT